MNQKPSDEQRRGGFSFSFEIGDGVLKVLIAALMAFFILGGRVSCASHDDELTKPTDPATTQPSVGETA